MLVRAIALSLALLIGVGIFIPLATNDAEAKPRKHRKHRKHYKKYSKGWWRQYHARMKRKRAMAARARALRLRQLRMAKAAAQGPNAAQPASSTSAAKATPVMPSGAPAPTGWTPAQMSPGELQFRIDNSSGSQVGAASISVVGPAVNNQAVPSGKAIGGVPTTSLRREVIDRMIRENGWVMNDYQKEIGGQQVYVVEAQAQSKTGGLQSRVFYFTEVDGRIYNVATNSSVRETERVAEESEKVINSLKARVKPTERASIKN